MALQKKFRSLMSTLKTPEDDITSSQLASDPAVTKFIHVNEFPNDPQADREAIDSIEQVYFQDGDPTQNELLKLSESWNLNEIETKRDTLRRQHSAVSKKVSELVLENHPAYVVELQRVMELQDSLQRANVICANGRRNLGLATKRFTAASLGLLKNFRKRQQLHLLLRSLHTIKTLQRTDVRLREMLEEEDYPGAIQLCLECQKAASTFRQYKCISELSSKLQDTLLMIEEQLDVALSKTCGRFDKEHYEKLQTAYRLLGKTQTATDQLLMHFTSAIHNTAFTITLGYVELIAGTGDGSFQKRQYSDLCKHISIETFTPCLIDLCKALWQVMKSYFLTMEWHEKFDSAMDPAGETGSQNVEATFNRRYIKQKLEHGLVRIWGDVQQKIRVFLQSTDLAHYKYDEFLQVLNLVNRLVQIGEEFCGSKSEGIQDTIRKHSLNYFHNYHRSKMDELRMFLENEGWELCPVKSSFSILHLQEFKFLRRQLNKSTNSLNMTTKSAASSDSGKTKYGFFERYCDSGNPFDMEVEEDEHEEDVLATNGYGEEHGGRSMSPDTDSDSEIADELKQDFVDERTGEVPKQPIIIRRRRASKVCGKLPPIITNTTLNVCRLFGKYMQMMSVLKTIAFDVTFSMSLLFDYYLYAVYSFFALDRKDNTEDAFLSPRLRTTLTRIQENLILRDDDHVSDDRKDKFLQPHISPIVDLSGSEQLHGLAERIVAVESLVFLSKQFEYLQPHLEAVIPHSKKAFLQQFYSQTVNTAPELRKPVYHSVATKSIDYEQIQTMMASVHYDIRDIESQHSRYVDALLGNFEVFSNRLQSIARHVPLPKIVSDVLWEQCIRTANRTFVEGFGNARKCTNEGRALMQLDYQQFLMKLEKLTDLRPIPGRDYVEVYVKAYYLPEDQLEIWMKDHKEYSTRQLFTLINCIPHVSKKARSRFLVLIEETEKIRR